MNRYQRKNNIFLRLRFLGSRVFVLWLLVLHHLAFKSIKSRGAGTPFLLNNREYFLIKNRQIQQNLVNIFTHYYHCCMECDSVCCLNEKDIPYFYFDHILHGSQLICDIKAPDKKALIRFILNTFTPIAILRTLLNFVRSFPKAIKEATVCEMEPLPPCPALTSSGCNLPCGQRAAVCLIYICEPMHSEMDWKDFWRYLGESASYLAFLTLMVRKVRLTGGV
jgi:hypothetical protein